MEKKVLLIADDEEMNRKIICRFLKSDFNVIEAENGKKVLKLLETTHVDALLLDIIMPELDGLEVLKQVKEQKEYEHIGILVATSTMEDTERMALSLGADDVVSKPYDPIVIKKRLSNILSTKAMCDVHKESTNSKTSLQLENSLTKIELQVQKTTSQIDKYINIIGANKDNFKLVDEILNAIKLETDNLTKTVSDNI